VKGGKNCIKSYQRNPDRLRRRLPRCENESGELGGKRTGHTFTVNVRVLLADETNSCRGPETSTRKWGAPRISENRSPRKKKI